MPTLLQDLDSDEMTLCRRPAVPRARVAVVKSHDARSTPTHPTMRSATGIVAALRSAFGAVEKSDDDAATVDTALAEVEAALAGDDLSTEAFALDSPDPELAMAAVEEIGKLQDLRKSLETEREQLSTLRKQIEDEREQVAVTKAETDARAMLGDVSGDVAALGSLLRKASPAERTALEASYRSLQAIAKSGAPTRFGTLRVMKSDAESLETVAKALQDKDPTLSAEQAAVNAAKLRPELYEADVRAARQSAAAEGY